MTPEQQATLKAYILADPVLGPLTSGPGTDYGAIATAMSADASPAFWVYRSSLSRHDILTGTGPDGTTFAWAAGAYITRSQGERDAFREMFNSTGSINPALPSIQAAFNDIFSGAGGAGNRTHITGMSRRKATVAEKVLATGNGAVATPATATFEGGLSLGDVASMFNV